MDTDREEGIQNSNRIYRLKADGSDAPGWPLNFNGNWILNAPTLSDVDENGVYEVLFNEFHFILDNLKAISRSVLLIYLSGYSILMVYVWGVLYYNDDVNI